MSQGQRGNSVLYTLIVAFVIILYMVREESFAKMADIRSQLEKVLKMQFFEETVTIPGSDPPRTVLVHTERLRAGETNEESIADWKARHNAVVQSWLNP